MAHHSPSPWRGIFLLAVMTAWLLSLSPGHTWIESQVLSKKAGRSNMARIRRRAQESPKEVLEDMKEMKVDMEAMRKTPNPRNGKRVGGEVWFDVELSKPLGLRLDENDRGDMVGVSEVIEGGSAFEHAKAVLAETEESKKELWIQPGDRLLQMNGQTTNTQEAAVEELSNVPEGEKVRLKIARPSRGPIKVIFPEPAIPVVVRGSTRLADAAKAAGHMISMCDEDVCRGKCWHMEQQTKVIYQLCIADCVASRLPNKASERGEVGEQFAGVMSALTKFGGDPPPGTTWDNTEPLVLKPCSEIYDRDNDPHLGNWRYLGGQYTVTRDEETDDLVWAEYKAKGILLPEDEKDAQNRWLVADLAEFGMIRIRLSEGIGITVNMDSQYKESKDAEWDEEMKSAVKVDDDLFDFR